MRLLWLTAALLLASLAGCVQSDPDVCEDCDVLPPMPEPASTQTVVAVIDTGTTPYHAHFQRPGGVPASILDRAEAAIGTRPETVHLTSTGGYEERLEADEEVWEGLEQGVLYTFADTNILGISFGSQVPVLDDGGSSHGTATTGAVLDADPDAIIVLVEGDFAQGEAWVAQQPWIDIVSMSYGPIGSVPGTGQVFGLDTHTNTKAMWTAGQVPVGAADNTPAPAPNDETAGPPWVIGVGGDHPETECREHRSASFPDFTADFTQELPRAYTVDEYRETSGTSFSTPTTAGTLSAVLHAVRDAWGHTTGLQDGVLAAGPEGATLTNADLRAAIERTAYYFGAGCAGGTPVNPAAPWAQQGWGHVGPEIVNATVAHLLGIEEAPEKPAGAQAFMGAQMTYRETLWGTLP